MGDDGKKRDGEGPASTRPLEPLDRSAADKGPTDRRVTPSTAPPAMSQRTPPRGVDRTSRLTPPPMQRVTPPTHRSTPASRSTFSSLAPIAGPDDHNVTRGARNVVTRCLCVAPGERVHILTNQADALYALMARAVGEADAIPVRVPIEVLDGDGATVSELVARLLPELDGATATMLLAPKRPSPAMSMAIAKATEKLRARHLHLLEVDERLLGQSVRADPELLAIVNARFGSALQPPCQLRVSSETGTDLEVRLALSHPVLSSSGRPQPGTSENLPAGLVYTHPARVSGTLVVDRAMFGPGITLDRSLVRRTPIKVRFGASRLSSFECADPVVEQALGHYLDSHADAARVGLLVFPTNYLARSDVGIDRQDMLLPGVSVSLGFSSAETTGAPYDAPVQLVLLGRRQTVERLGGRRLVDAGRLDDALVEGIDPFR
jgi:hypothetical protein